MKNTLHFPHQTNNSLFQLLNEPGFASALCYLVTFKNYDDLIIKAHQNSIELANDEVKIFIVIYTDFVTEEYPTLKDQSDLHLVCLDQVSLEMFEFADLPLKKIDKLAWMFAIMEKSESTFVQNLNKLRTLRID